MAASACSTISSLANPVYFPEEHHRVTDLPRRTRPIQGRARNSDTSAIMSNGILRIEGEQVVDGNGNAVILRGAGLGGWMKYALPKTYGTDGRVLTRF